MDLTHQRRAPPANLEADCVRLLAAPQPFGGIRWWFESALVWGSGPQSSFCPVAAVAFGAEEAMTSSTPPCVKISWTESIAGPASSTGG
jgi:hypothetical protein